MERQQVIFISYRRSEHTALAGRLSDRLKRSFPKHEVFYDLESIQGAENFREVMVEKLRNAKLVIPLIGHQWNFSSSEPNLARLKDPDDHVRFELSTALLLKREVLPLRVDDVVMPIAADLPHELFPLLGINAVPLRQDLFDHDYKRVESEAKRVLIPSGFMTGRKIAAAVIAVLLLFGVTGFFWFADLDGLWQRPGNSDKGLIVSEPANPFNLPSGKIEPRDKIIITPEQLEQWKKKSPITEQAQGDKPADNGGI